MNTLHIEKCQYTIQDSLQIFTDIKKKLFEEKPVSLHYNSLTFGIPSAVGFQQLISNILLPN
jgi:hypothetical protein